MDSLTPEELNALPDAAPSPASLTQDQLDHLPDHPHQQSLTAEELSQLPDTPSQDQGSHIPILSGLWNAAKSAGQMVSNVFGAAKDIATADPSKSWSENAQNYFSKIPDLRNADPTVVDALKGGDTGVTNTGFLASAHQQLVADDHGIIMKGLIGLSMPEQFAARETMAMMKNMGMINADDARKMLSQEDFHFNDIVNFYWKNPSSFAERTARFAFGLGSTILADPLNVINPVGLLAAEGGKFVTIAGQVIDITKMGRGEQLLARNASRISKVLEEGYKLADVPDAVASNTGLLGQYRAGKISLTDLQQSLLNPMQNSQLMAGTINELKLQTPGVINDLKQGYRGMQFGIKVPFSDLGFSIDLPVGPLNRFGGEMMSKFATTTGKIVDSNGITGGLHRGWNQLFTQTGKPFYDAANRTYEGAKYAGSQAVNDFSRAARSLVGDATDEEVNDIIHSLEFGPVKNKMEVLDQNEKIPFEITKPTYQKIQKLELDDYPGQAGVWRGPFKDDVSKPIFHGENFPPINADQEKRIWDRLKSQNPNDPNTPMSGKHFLGLKPGESSIGTSPLIPTKELQSLYQTPKDLEIWNRMPEEHQKFVSSARQMMEDLAAEYKTRPGIPFEELNPFGPGWARTYIKHKFNNQYLKSFQDQSMSMEYAYDKLANSIGKVDWSTGGRSYRGSILEANAESLEKTGVKLFVDDPVELVTTRMHEMGEQVRRYDLMDAASKEAALVTPGTTYPSGWVKFNPEHFRNDTTVFQNTIQPRPQAFVPPFFKQAFERDAAKAAGQAVKDIYLPPEVYDNMLYKIGGQQYGKMADFIIDANNKFMWPFRNMALFGPGFIGRHIGSRVTNYLTSGVTDPVRSYWDSLKFFSPLEPSSSFSFFQDGEKLTLPREEFLQMAHEDGVVGASISNIANASAYDYAENIASTAIQRETMGKKIANGWDAVTLWRHNRAIIENSDNSFRMALYMDRLKNGFSRQAASEAVERYFYNFNNTPQAQDIMRRVFPFSSFAMKTLEKSLGELKDGQFGRMAIPGKVAQVLSGQYLPDTDVRDAMEMGVPGYSKILTAHGPLMPGAREVMLEAPWATHALEFFLDPEKNMHPALKVIFGDSSSKQASEEFGSQQTQDTAIRTAAKQLWNYAPFEVREGLAIAEINGWINTGGAFQDLMMKVGADKFATLATNYPFAQRYNISPSTSKTGKDQQAMRFGNAFQFGQFMEEHAGEHWLYRTIFPDRVNMGELTPRGMQETVERGEYIRQHFRDFSLGMARMDKTDSQFLANMGAMKRTETSLQKEIIQNQMSSGMLPNFDALNDTAQLKEMSKHNYKAAQLLELQSKQATLATYYNWYLGTEKKYPGLNLQQLIFGSDKYFVDWTEKPEMKDFDPRQLPRGHFRDLIKQGASPQMPEEPEEPQVSGPPPGE